MNAPLRIAINGFGRIGRGLLRVAAARPQIAVTNVNDPMPVEQAAYLLTYDSVMGRFDGRVETRGDALLVNGRAIAMTHTRDSGALRWGSEGVDVVVNSSGASNDRKSCETCLTNGARYVVISAPAPDVADAHILAGVNDNDLSSAHRIVSAGSCTAHCFAPIVRMLADEYTVLRGFLQTVHAYTSSQNLTDGPHSSDVRRGRSGAANIVPTTTEAIKAFEAACPRFRDLLHGMAMRVPVADGSNIDLILHLDREVARDEINALVRRGCENRYRGIVSYCSDPVVSSDIIGDQHSCVFDSLLTDCHGPLVRLFLWYDNEWGYTNRLADLLGLLARPGS